LNSLERSLQMGLIGALVVLLFIFWWTITLSSRLLTDSFIFSRLQSEAQTLASMLSNDTQLHTDDQPSQQLGLPDQLLKPAYRKPASGHYFLVQFANDKRLMSRSSWDQFFTLPELVPGEQRKHQRPGIAGEPLLFWMGGYQRNGERFSVVVAQDVTPVRKRLAVFQWFSAAIALVLFGVLLSIQRLIMKSSLQKLDVIRRDMLRLEQGKIVALPENVPSEILPLVREFNQLLRRFDQRLRQSRNAVGNLAHSLKGPLNLLLRAADTQRAFGAETPSINALDHDASNANELSPQAANQDGQSIAHNAEHIRRLIESELKRARLAGRGSAGKRLDLKAELPAMIGLLQQVYSEKKIDVRFSIDAVVDLAYDRQDMLELIGNLLDNAVKWSRSQVTMKLSFASGILIEVEDDGPGCSPEMLGHLTGRGVCLSLRISPIFTTGACNSNHPTHSAA